MWIAFGGGAHKCIGMHFAFTRPLDELPVRLVARQNAPLGVGKGGGHRCAVICSDAFLFLGRPGYAVRLSRNLLPADRGSTSSELK